MTTPSSLEELREIDDIILAIVHKAGLIPRGKTVSADMFAEEKAMLRSHMEAVISDLIGEDLVPNTFDDRWVRQIPPNITHYETEHDAKIINENNSYQRQRAKSYLEGEK